MFTGIVEEVGRVAELARRGEIAWLEIAAENVVDGLRVGDSIAVNGACLTAVAVRSGGFALELVPETLRRTNLGALEPGSAVNLERALMPTSRMGGHFVQGHIDATGDVVALKPQGESTLVRFRAPAELLRYVVPKGFIAIDGASLTVVDVDRDRFRIAYVPHTLVHTIAGGYRPGDRVNLEPDILGKYVERLIAASPMNGESR